MTAMKLKRDVLDALDKEYTFALPEKLVEAEFNGIWNALQNEMKRAGKSFADENTTEDEARKEYRAIAERRVRLGLVLGTMGEKEQIQVYDYYRKNPSALIELRGPIFEQKVVDLLVGKAAVTDKDTSREDLQKMVEEDMDGEE
jgi:trigger factor